MIIKNDYLIITNEENKKDDKFALVSEIIIWLMLFSSMLATLFCFYFGDDEIPIIWNIVGVPILYASKGIIMFVVPLSSLLFQLALTMFPHIDPRKENYVTFSRAYIYLRMVVSICFTIFTCIYLVGINVTSTSIVFAIFKIITAIAIILVGNILPKIKRNYFIGITNPWTLDNELVWYKTHRFSGRLYVISGLIMLILSSFNYVVSNVIFITTLVFNILVPIFYSAKVFYYIKRGGIK